MIEAFYSLKSNTKIGNNLCIEKDRKKRLKNLLENKVLTESIDPSEGLICQKNYALRIRAQKGKRQVSQTWERLLKPINILQYTEKF